MIIDRNFYTRDSVTLIAKELIGKAIFTYIDRQLTTGIITEVEAYAGITDRASHAYKNRKTSRTQVMYEEGGVAYVYLCYGVHHLFNVVTNKMGIPDAVLLRGILPAAGRQIMEKRIGRKFPLDGCANGPGITSKALGINVNHNSESLMGAKIWIEEVGHRIIPKEIIARPRIGVDYAGKDALLPYRFLLNETALNRIKKAQQNAELFLT